MTLRASLLCCICLLCQEVLAVTIAPEKVTPVALSNRDVNRLVCSEGTINDVVYSSEKGISVKTQGDNAFVKFLIKNTSGEGQYVTVRSELYVVCSGSVYTLMAEPKDIPGQTIRLSSGTKNRLKANIDRFGSLPEEKRALEMTRLVYLDEIPESFAVTDLDAEDAQAFAGLPIHLKKKRIVRMDGMGLKLTEYQVLSSEMVQLSEADFMEVALGENIFAITIEPKALGPGQAARLLIVQKEGG